MDSSKKILAILAIFCVLASAGAVCAADDFGSFGFGYADDNSGYAGSQYNETLENATANAAGEPTNATNTTAQAAGEPVNETNATAGTTHSMLATGNPILILLAVIAVLGGYAAFKRK